ncbi:MAG: hypothetical protein OXE75_17540 [bacterium]|nr:hypothetical protein [bacterium]
MAAATRLIGSLVLLCCVAAACGSAATPSIRLEPLADRLPADPEAPTDAWVAGVNAAGWDFHRHLVGNAVSSPLSIGTAFSLSRAGASGDSGAVLDEIFGFPEVDPHGAANAVDLMVAEASVEPTTLEVATRLFPDDEFHPLPAFLDTASAHYGTSTQPIDTADEDAAADTVNRWVSERTRGLIPKIVTPPIVRDQRLVLANTVYLKADWVVPFLSELTSSGPFTTDDNRSVTVPFMHDREPVPRRYVLLDGADAVELPYQGGELAMWLVVPHDPAGLPAVEETLDAAALTGLPAAAKEGLVDLTMPKWEQTLPPTDLFEWLCPLGFCEGAAFDRIAPGIFITAALHGAKVIVDEKGTEAAAATAMGFAESGPPPADLTIVADRPFLWAIVHEGTGAVLFVGRLVEPGA